MPSDLSKYAKYASGPAQADTLSPEPSPAAGPAGDRYDKYNKYARPLSPTPDPTPEEVQDEALPGANLQDPDRDNKVLTRVPEGPLREIYGDTTYFPSAKRVTESGQFADMADYNATYNDVADKLADKRLKVLMAEGVELTPEVLGAELTAVRQEAKTLTAQMLGEAGSQSAPMLDPTRALTKDRDSKDLAEGLLPEGQGNIAGKVRDAQEAVLEATGGREMLKASAKVLESTGMVDGLVGDDGALGRIPVRVGPVPMRTMAAMLYPHQGFEAGDFNLLTKMAQDFVAPNIAVADEARKMTDEEGGNFLDYMENWSKAASSVEAIDAIRGNKSTWEYAEEAETTSMTAVPWLAMKALTGKDLNQMVEGSVLTKGFNTPMLGILLQSTRPRYHVANLLGATEMAKGGEFEAGFEKVGIMTPEHLEHEVLGPLSAAIFTPDILSVGLGPVLKAGVKGARAVKSKAILKQVEGDIKAVTSLRDALAEAVAKGEPLPEALPKMYEAVKNVGLRNQLDELFRDAIGVSDKRNMGTVATYVERYNKSAMKQLEDVSAILEQYGKDANPKLLLARPATKGGIYDPLFTQVPARDKSSRHAVLNAELSALEHKAMASGLSAEMLRARIKMLRGIGLMHDGKLASPARVKALRKQAEAAIRGLERNATVTGSAAGIDVNLRALNGALNSLTSVAKAQADDALKALLIQADEAYKLAKGDLDVLEKAAMSEDMFLGLSAAQRRANIIGEVEKIAEGNIPRNISRSDLPKRLLNTIDNAIDSLGKARAKMADGRILVKSGQDLPVDHAAFHELKTADEQLQFIQDLAPQPVYDALAKSGALSKLLDAKPQKLAPAEGSNVLRSMATAAGTDATTAWGLHSYVQHARGVNVAGLPPLYKGSAFIEGFIDAIKVSGLRKAFNIKAGMDTLNLGRLGVESSNLGMKELSGVVRSARNASSDEVVKVVKRFVSETPQNQLTRFGQSGYESPLDAAFRFFRSLDEGTVRGTNAFRAMARSMLKSGEMSAGSARAAEDALYELVKGGEKVEYENLVKVLSEALGDNSVKALRGADEMVEAPLNTLAHQHLAAGIVNAASGQRMVEAFVLSQAGFDLKALKGALELSLNKGAVGRGADGAGARAVLESMGLSAGDFRRLVRKTEGGGIAWNLASLKGDSGAMNAIMPRPLLEALGADLTHIVKATDPSKPVILGIETAKISAALNSVIRLYRQSITHGLSVPTPRHFYKNLVGFLGQVTSSASVDSALATALGAGAVDFRKVALSALGVGHKGIDAKMALISKEGRIAGQKVAVLPPPNVFTNNRFVQGLLDDSLIAPETVFITGMGERLTKTQLLQEAIKEGVFSTQSSAFLLEKSGDVVRRMQGAKVNSSSRWWEMMKRGLRWVQEHPDRLSGIMDTVESYQRMALFADTRLRKGMTSGDSGRLVREAAFDWSYPNGLLTETMFKALPVAMFASMWKNAAGHTLATLADPTKTWRMMSAYKGMRIGAEAMSEDIPEEIPGFTASLPWWQATSAAPFVTRPATETERAEGVLHHGAPTGVMATALPNMLNHDLVLLAANSALVTAAMANNFGNTPVTHANMDAYTEYLARTVSQFMDPFIVHALGLKDSGYTGPVKVNAGEAHLLNSWLFKDWAGANVRTKEIESTGSQKRVADRGPVTAIRFMPGFTRVARIIEPFVREEWGPDSGDVFKQIIDAGQREMGMAPSPVPTTSAEYSRRQDILKYKVREIR